MHHDLLAELAGYTNELRLVSGNPGRAEAVKSEIRRVREMIQARADEYATQAEEHDRNGSDVLAAQARVEGRRYLAALEEGQPEDATDSRPRETATQRRRGAK